MLFFTLSCSSFFAKSQTADEVVSKYVQFIGGVQNWKAVKTITTSGIYNYGGMKVPYKAYSKSPDRYKYVVAFKGKSFTQAYNGKTGWRIDGFKNETKKTMLKDRQATALAKEADVELESPFINYREKGHTIMLEGMDTADKKTYYKINLMRRDGDTATYFFDSKDFSLAKNQAISKNAEMNNAPLDIFYSNYLQTGNVRIPHKISCTSEGQKILTITVESIKLNAPMTDKMFQP